MMLKQRTTTPYSSSSSSDRNRYLMSERVDQSKLFIAIDQDQSNSMDTNSKTENKNKNINYPVCGEPLNKMFQELMIDEENQADLEKSWYNMFDRST